jgi:hypothetical protein
MPRRFWLFLCLVLLQGSCGSHRNDAPPPEKNAPPKVESPVADLQNKIKKWQSNRDKLKKLLEQMQTDKTDILEKLVELGVKSESDLANNPKGQVLHGELKDIVKQIALYDKKLQDYELAILKSESRVRSIARQLSAREAGVSDTELAELTRSMVILDESLSSEKESAIPIDLKDTLKDELARYHEKSKSESAQAKPKPLAPIVEPKTDKKPAESSAGGSATKETETGGSSARDSSSWRLFVGRWNCTDIIITLNADFTAHKSPLSNTQKEKGTGTWSYVNGEAHIVWRNGNPNRRGF